MLIHRSIKSSCLLLFLVACGRGGSSDPTPGTPGPNNPETESPKTCIEKQKQEVSTNLGLTTNTDLTGFFKALSQKDEGFWKDLSYCSRGTGS